MEIIRYVYKCNLENMLNYDITLGKFIESSNPESYFISEHKKEQENLNSLKKQAIQIKIIIPDITNDNKN